MDKYDEPPSLLAKLRNPNPRARRHAINQLYSLYASENIYTLETQPLPLVPLVNALEKSLKDSSREVRKWAAYILASIYIRTQQWARLQLLLTHPRKIVRAYALEAVGQAAKDGHNVSRLLPVLERMLETDPSPREYRCAFRFSSIQSAAVFTAVTMYSMELNAAGLLRLLEHENPQVAGKVRARFTETMGHIINRIHDLNSLDSLQLLLEAFAARHLSNRNRADSPEKFSLHIQITGLLQRIAEEKAYHVADLDGVLLVGETIPRLGRGKGVFRIALQRA